MTSRDDFAHRPADGRWSGQASPGTARAGLAASLWETWRCGLRAQAASVGSWPGNGPLRCLVGGGGPGRNVAEVFADGGVQTALVVVALAVAGHQAVDADPARGLAHG